jgi:16S rRNA (uracil1498-N3)-methyltransferase
MTRRRFFAPPSAFNSHQQSVVLAAEEARYLREILRLKTGDEVYVFDGEGKEFQCTVDESRRESARLEIVSEVGPARPESPLQLTLAVALLKSDKFDLVVQKTTELGVTRLVPVTTKLADIRLREASDATKRVARWQRIALEAAKQSGRAVVPVVLEPVAFESFIQTDAADSTAQVMFSERDGHSLVQAQAKLPANVSSVTALVGSEGGWTDHEIVAARDAGWLPITLGGRTLRAETAAIAVTVLLQHLFGDLS